jgi:hypothetical protein
MRICIFYLCIILKEGFIMKIPKLGSIFNARSRKSALWGLGGGQVGLDLGAALVITGVVATAAAPLTLVFGAVACAVGAGVTAFKLTQPENKPSSFDPPAPAAPSL